MFQRRSVGPHFVAVQGEPEGTQRTSRRRGERTRGWSDGPTCDARRADLFRSRSTCASITVVTPPRIRGMRRLRSSFRGTRTRIACDRSGQELTCAVGSRAAGLGTGILGAVASSMRLHSPRVRRAGCGPDERASSVLPEARERRDRLHRDQSATKESPCRMKRF